MPTFHLNVSGSWSHCTRENCTRSIFHLRDMTAAEVLAMPFYMLLPLFEAAQPFTKLDEFGSKIWEGSGLNANRMHRDYDLPAVIMRDGQMEWWQHGTLHREDGKPAVLRPSGRNEYWRYGVRVK